MKPHFWFLIKIHYHSYQTSLYCVSESISASMAQSKQSAESKQTADMIKNHNFSSLTSITLVPMVLLPLYCCICVFDKSCQKEEGRSQISSIDSLRAMALARKKQSAIRVGGCFRISVTSWHVTWLPENAILPLINIWCTVVGSLAR